MNEQILEEIQRTNDILIRLSIIVLVGVIFWCLRSVTLIWTQIQGIRNRIWRDWANRLWNEGKIDRLRKEAIEKAEKEPRNAEGFYWKALAERELNMKDELPKTLKRVMELAPKWKEDWMDEYLNPQITACLDPKANSEANKRIEST